MQKTRPNRCAHTADASPLRLPSRSLPALAGLVLFGLLGSSVLAGASLAGSQEIMPIDEVRPGMKGVGRTVFQGDSISEFDLEIVAVLKNSRAKGDIILFRGRDPVLDHAGIIAGMSGSPVYIDGRLVGAVSYAYPYSKDPIGGITPIGEMLDLLDLPAGRPAEEVQDSETQGGGGRAGRPASAISSAAASASAAGGASAAARASAAADGGSAEGFGRAWNQFLGLRPAPAGSGPEDGSAAWSRSDRGGGAPSYGSDRPPDPGAPAPGMEALAVPLSLSGWAAPLQASMVRELRSFGFVSSPVAGGGSGGYGEESADANASAGTGAGAEGSADRGAPFEPGSAIGVSLIRGDANLAAIGTVTYVEGNQVLAFGHPMIQSGPIGLPMTKAWIHTVMPNLEVSYKLGASTRMVGALWEDRRPGVAGAIGEVPNMLPVRITLTSPGSPDRDFNYQVVRHPALTPLFLPWTVANSYLSAGWAQGDATARSEVTIHFNGGRQVRRVEHFSTDSPGTTFGGEITLPASVLLLNPFEVAHLDSVEVNLSYERKNTRAVITSLRSYPSRVAVGDTLRLQVTLEPHRAAPEMRSVEIPIPGGWAGKRLLVTASGSTEAMESDRDRAPDKYSPRSLTELKDLIEEIPNESDLIVRVVSRDPGHLIEGRELPGLPPSLAVAGAERGGRAVVRSTQSSILDERKTETSWILSGRESVEVEVRR